MRGKRSMAGDWVGLAGGVVLAIASVACATTQADQEPAGARPSATADLPTAATAVAPPSVAPPDGSAAAAVGPETASYEDAIMAIARAIESAKDDFPQLADFSAEEHCDRQRLVISYGYHTHRSEHRGGWTAAVSNPDDDGVWFHLDFHEPSSMAQIHTQPVVPRRSYRDKRVMLLLLDGKQTKGLGARLEQILAQHGVRGP